MSSDVPAQSGTASPSADELVHWRIERTKLLKDILPGDIPCGLSAYDIAIDYRPEP